MNKFKKTIATVLAMLMTITVLPMQAGAAVADDAAAEEDIEPIMEYAPDGADVDVSSNGFGVDTCEPIIDPQFTYADPISRLQTRCFMRAKYHRWIFGKTSLQI